MYFTHRGIVKTSIEARIADDGDIWLQLTDSYLLSLSKQEARRVIELLQCALGDGIDSPPADDPASLYREAYFAGMADGPAPGPG
jgi:hypothetical protein